MQHRTALSPKKGRGGRAPQEEIELSDGEDEGSLKPTKMVRMMRYG